MATSPMQFMYPLDEMKPDVANIAQFEEGQNV